MRAEMGKDPSRAPQSQLNLPPGFRFYPTDEELVVHYLCKKAACEPFAVPIIAEVELYKFDPWDLPERALFGEKEWYFFSPRDRKYPNGSRPNRAAGSGYWKATGTDKPITTLAGNKKVGVKKALVFYKGKAPKGTKTNWIMHEYRLAEAVGGSKSHAKRKLGASGGSLRLDDWVLCRIYKKCSSAATAANNINNSSQKPNKERSEAASCFDEVLASLPEIDVRLNPLKGLQEMDKPAAAAGFSDFYDGGHYMPDMSALEQASNFETELIGRSYSNSEGVSSFEEGNEEERQHSPPESTVEEDSVESTFDTLPAFTNGRAAPPNLFNGLGAGVGGSQFFNNGNSSSSSGLGYQPFFSFEGLPSPLGLGGGGGFPSFSDSDYFSSTALPTTINNTSTNANANASSDFGFLHRSIC